METQSVIDAVRTDQLASETSSEAWVSSLSPSGSLRATEPGTRQELPLSGLAVGSSYPEPWVEVPASWHTSPDRAPLSGNGGALSRTGTQSVQTTGETSGLAPHQGSSGRALLTPAQRVVFEDLLDIGSPRPTAPQALATDLRAYITEHTAAALAKWTERNLWVGKSLLNTALRCEGQLAADAAQPRNRPLPLATAVGVVVHRAVQLSHTHPGRTPEQYVQAALQGSRTEEAFEAFWTTALEHLQSDLIVQSTSRLVSFLDSVPPLQASWAPRFEEPLSVKIGPLVLAARPDLILGRPRPDGRQTMFLCDVKSTDLRDYHFDEAMFYALVATLRYGCAPYRSCVLSLTTVEWTEADVTVDRLWDAAKRVVEGVNRIVEVLTETRGASLLPGHHCTWCPAKKTCPSQEAWQMAGQPADPTPYAIAAAPVTIVSPPPKQLVSTPASHGGNDVSDDPYAL
jgi:hypothetical protein